jgi:ribonuclease HIII
MNNELVQKNFETFCAFVKEAGFVILKEETAASGGRHMTVTDGKHEHNVIISQKGKINVQGKGSPLKTTLDSFVPQILSSPTSLSAIPPPLTPGKVQEGFLSLSSSLKDQAQVDQNVLAWVDEQVGLSVRALLSQADQAIYLSGVKLLLQVKEQQLVLTDYTPLIMPFARAYEGFLVQVACCLNQSFGEKNDLPTAEDGICLLKQKCQASDAPQNPGLVDTLQSAWRDIHHSVMFANLPSLSRYPRLALAEQAIGIIHRAIHYGYETLSVGGWIGKESLAYEKNESARIGMDESGKCDCFGPLVVSAVYVNELMEQRLIAMGVRDSKKVKNEQRILALAEMIQECCPHATVCIEPLQYQDLYHKLGNENKLLAQGHAQALEQVLEQAPCSYAIVDQFGKASLLQEVLLPMGRLVRLEQRPRAEEDVAVAAASIVARATFLKWLKLHSDRVGKDLPKGSAASSTNKVAHAILAESGEQVLAEVVKLPEKISKTTRVLTGNLME